MSITLRAAVEQLELLRAGKISALELADEHIRRVERLNPVLNAIVDFDADRVREQARNAVPGPLQGLPVTIKASIAVEGHRCEVGSVLRRGEVARCDAEAVRLLRQAGAVILGITNCTEFLMAYETENELHGRTLNPWDLERTPGGSSGGEAAAIAAGLSPAGLGSDSGGSVRQPAHFTGICSLKPTSGRISAIGHEPPNVGPFSTLGAIGPMARTLADVRLLFKVASERCRFDPASPPVPYREVTLEEAKQVPIGWFEEDGPVTPETRRAVRMAADALREQGFRVEEIRPPHSLEAARKLWDVFFVQCGAMFYEPIIAGRREELSPIFKEYLRIAASRTPLRATTLLAAWAELDGVRQKLLEEMRAHPLVLTPVCAVPAFRHGERVWGIDGHRVEYLEAMRYMQWFNVLGAPAAVVPVNRSENGLPIGVQVAGVPYTDELVLTVAGALDSVFGYTPPPFAAG